MLATTAVVAGLVVVIVIVAGADGQLSALYGTECPAACTAVLTLALNVAVLAFESAAHGDDVKKYRPHPRRHTWGRDWLSLQYA